MSGKDIEGQHFSFLLRYDNNFILRQKQWNICENREKVGKKEEKKRREGERDMLTIIHVFIKRD